MAFPDDPDAFEVAFRSAVTAVLPSARIELIARTIVTIKLRVGLDQNRFIDAFFNARNGRTDLAVIEGTQRVFGYDNLGGWHRHSPNAPEQHESCDEPGLEDFVREAVSLIQNL